MFIRLILKGFVSFSIHSPLFLSNGLEVKADIETVAHDIGVDFDHVLVGPHEHVEVGFQEACKLFF